MPGSTDILSLTMDQSSCSALAEVAPPETAETAERRTACKRRWRRGMLNSSPACPQRESQTRPGVCNKYSATSRHKPLEHIQPKRSKRTANRRALCWQRLAITSGAGGALAIPQCARMHMATWWVCLIGFPGAHAERIHRISLRGLRHRTKGRIDQHMSVWSWERNPNSNRAAEGVGANMSGFQPSFGSGTESPLGMARRRMLHKHAPKSSRAAGRHWVCVQPTSWRVVL